MNEIIRSYIDRLPMGYIFTYADVSTEVNRKEAIIKALNRMVQSGRIAKVSKGKYYKPTVSVFGKLCPQQSQIVKDLLKEDGKVIGYLTGYSIYNQLGLTTQVSNTIQIGKNEIRPSFNRERYRIAFIKQKNTITTKNIPLLQILDAIRYIRKIPDTSLSTACTRLLAIMKRLSKENKLAMVRLAQKYPPSTRALLGAILEKNGDAKIVESLYSSINPITTYRYRGIEKVLPNAAKWNIKGISIAI